MGERTLSSMTPWVLDPARLLRGLLSPVEGVPGGVTYAMRTFVSTATVLPGDSVCSIIPYKSNNWVTVR